MPIRILLTGASGQLGSYLLGELLARGHPVVAWTGSTAGRADGVDRIPVDLADPDSCARALDAADPDAVLHAAAISRADAVLRDPEHAHRVNVLGTAALADWCGRRGRPLLYTSTDLVFDGAHAPYREDAPADPIVAYGRTKRDAEPAVLATPRGLVARLSLLYGPSRCGRPGFFEQALDALRRGEPRAFFEDEYRTPLDYATAAAALVGLLEIGATGRVHVGGPERLSRFELMRRSATALGLEPSVVQANRRDDLDAPEPRPADVSLDTTLLARLLPGLRRPTVEEAVRLS